MSITRQKFNDLKPGDYLLMKSGRIRKILKVTHCFGARVQIKPRTSIVLEKLSKVGKTYYVYNDLKSQIKGIFRTKIKNYDCSNT